MRPIYVFTQGGIVALEGGAATVAAVKEAGKQIADDVANLITGNAGANALSGGAGDDTLNGGGGNDAMVGGAGNDTYYIDTSGDTVTEQANEGTDVVVSSLNWTLGDTFENVTLTGSAVTAAGNAANNLLIGNGLSNTLTGGAGNDQINGGAAADTMIGGIGDDSYYVDHLSDVAAESLGEGTDLVYASLSWTLGDNLENLVLTSNGLTSGIGNALNNAITGNGSANVLRGEQGNDTLNGAGGADTMIGGAGNDTYTVDQADDVTTEAFGEGIDLVNASISHTLSANIENLTLTGTSPLTAIGNELDNVLTGNAGANVLNGDAGNDTLNGAAGADSMAGGAGNDAYFVDSLLDVAAENANEGVDTVNSSVDWVLGQNFENLTLTGSSVNGTGNDLANVINGNASSNRLNGGMGVDTMAGGAGNDTYVVTDGDITNEAAGAGTDTVESAMSWVLANNLENLTLTGGSSVDATGNWAVNTLRGNSGGNRLDGAGGADTLIGGAGDDVYIVDTTSDAVTEGANEGRDRIESTATINALAANVEDLTLLGNAVLNGRGNALDNRLVGNLAGNVLTGDGGADVLNGAAGNDTLAGGVGADGYEFGAGFGVDTVQENDATAGTTDFVQFLGGMRQADAQFKQAGNNLEVLVRATADKIVVQNWYLGAQYQVEEFRFADGTILNTQMQSLVSAMAGFGAPSASTNPMTSESRPQIHMVAPSALTGTFA